MNGGRFDFDDGGTYCGGWEDGKAHGRGVCTGPKGQGEYSGAWHYGFEVSGVYTWPSGNSYEGQWQNGKRHGLGDERRGRWIYRGEWTQGYKGRYGIRHSANSQAKYEGTWANGLQDGYGTETYADGGTYQGQWLRGMRHGYGTRRSAPYGLAAKYRSRSNAHTSLSSLRSSDQGGDEKIGSTGNDSKEKKVEDSRGGFVLRARSEPPSRRRSLSEKSIAVKKAIFQGLRIKKQRSAGDINQRVIAGTGETPRSIRSSDSTTSCASDESAATGGYNDHREHGSLVSEFVDANATELYMGEWKNDKRSGFGVSERSDGLRYEGEWFNNKKFGYGVTTFKDGTKEEGKYKNNVLVTSQRKKNLLFVRSSKLRERIDSAVSASTRAAQLAVQKADIAVARSANARERADQADLAAVQAREDSEIARLCAKQFAPDFQQPGPDFSKTIDQIANHIGVPKAGRSALSLYIPKHTGSSYASLTAANEVAQQQSKATPMTPPMYTPPEEQPPSAAPTFKPVRPHGPPSKQLTFEEQPSSSSSVGGMQSEHSAITTIREESILDSSSKEAEGKQFAKQTTVTVRQHGGATLDSGNGTPHQDSQRQATASTRNAEGSQTSSESSSRNSLNLATYDHFDQYSLAANPVAVKAARASVYRQQQMLKRSAISSATGPSDDSTSSSLVRRTTLASSRDLKSASPQTGAARSVVETSGDVSERSTNPSELGSMPDISRLEKIPIHMSREETARLSSQRRQELHRIHEDAELVRSNPLRCLLYFFHPSIRAWIFRWKLPLLILLVNLCLSLVFYRLLTYSRDFLDDGDSSGHR